MRYVVSSDYHWHDPRCDQEAIRAFLEKEKGSFHIYNGDIFDLIFLNILDPSILSNEAIYIAGNHDPYEKLDSRGDKIPPLFREKIISNIMITHGDRYDVHYNYNWFLRFLLFFNAFFWLLFKFDWQSYLRKMNIKIGQFFGKEELFRYVFAIRDEAIADARKKNVDAVIIGHTHSTFYKYGGMLYNTGSWIRNEKRTYSYAVIESGKITMKEFAYGHDDHQPDQK